MTTTRRPITDDPEVVAAIRRIVDAAPEPSAAQLQLLRDLRFPGTVRHTQQQKRAS